MQFTKSNRFSLEVQILNCAVESKLNNFNISFFGNIQFDNLEDIVLNEQHSYINGIILTPNVNSKQSLQKTK